MEKEQDSGGGQDQEKDDEEADTREIASQICCLETKLNQYYDKVLQPLETLRGQFQASENFSESTDSSQDYRKSESLPLVSQGELDIFPMFFTTQSQELVSLFMQSIVLQSLKPLFKIFNLNHMKCCSRQPPDVIDFLSKQPTINLKRVDNNQLLMGNFYEQQPSNSQEFQSYDSENDQTISQPFQNNPFISLQLQQKSNNFVSNSQLQCTQQEEEEEHEQENENPAKKSNYAPVMANVNADFLNRLENVFKIKSVAKINNQHVYFKEVEQQPDEILSPTTLQEELNDAQNSLNNEVKYLKTEPEEDLREFESQSFSVSKHYEVKNNQNMDQNILLINDQNQQKQENSESQQQKSPKVNDNDKNRHQQPRIDRQNDSLIFTSLIKIPLRKNVPEGQQGGDLLLKNSVYRDKYSKQNCKVRCKVQIPTKQPDQDLDVAIFINNYKDSKQTKSEKSAKKSKFKRILKSLKCWK